MAEETPNYEGYLRRESLELKYLINIARGAPVGDWPPEDPHWLRLLEDIEFAILNSEIDGVVRRKPRFHAVRLRPFWDWLIRPERMDDSRWDPLRDACRQWAEARGETLHDRDKSAVTESESDGRDPFELPPVIITPSAGDEEDGKDLRASESQREQGKRKTGEKYQRWFELALKIMAEGDCPGPSQIASAIAKRERKRMAEQGIMEKGVNGPNIRRRLDEHFQGWSTPKAAQKKQTQKVGANF